ncbi:MAG: bifunctional lysine ketoglutarate reductase /saccharopine dehydrogenase family protein [Candidatus Odinarchaeota archaeon]
MTTIAIRREDKNVWERRTPITPADAEKLLKDLIADKIIVQPSEIRAFNDGEYRKVGCTVQESMSPASIVFAVKEIPINLIEANKTYVFFSHVIKCQEHNMPMLKKLMDSRCTLIDYEKVVNEKGLRLIFFGFYAGLSGMINTLAALGKRLHLEGIENPFLRIKQAHEYENLDVAKKKIKEIGEEIKENGLGLPEQLLPLTFGFAGYGNVSRGAQEILGLLPVKEIYPSELLNLSERDSRIIYKVVFKEEHMVKPKLNGSKFELQDYYNHPEKYGPQFGQYVPHLTVIMNCIYWDKMYPRLVTKKQLKELFTAGESPKIKVIGDISCDHEGAIEANIRTTDPGDPVFVYDPVKNEAILGHEGNGPVIMAVDNLPCETPIDSSRFFSGTLMPFLPSIVRADYTRKNFNDLNLPPEIKKAVILYQGEFTPDYRYLEKCFE